MANKNEIIKLAVDTYKNKIKGNFSKTDSLEVLREAFIELKGGFTKIDYKALSRNGVEMFEIIEEILQQTVLKASKTASSISL